MSIDKTANRKCYLFLFVSMAFMLMSACGGSSGENPSSEAQPQSEEIPGSEEFGLTMEGLALRVEQVEAAIGACMAGAGFEYIPVDFDTIRDAQGLEGTVPGFNDDDFLAEYGFGITTLLEQPNAMVETARGQNVATYEALSGADQVAYNRALFGENPDISFVVGLEDEDFSETGGCTRDAVDQFFTSTEVSGSYTNPGDVLIDGDPRMLAAFEEWSDCVAADGFDYDGPDDVDDDLADQLEAIVGDGDQSELTGQASAALSELQGYERTVAALSVECEEEILDPVSDQIETELYGAPQG